MSFGKRARRVGLADAYGNPVYKIYIRQSVNGVLWELADPLDAKMFAGQAAQFRRESKEIRAFIEKRVNVTHPQLFAFAKGVPVGEKKALNNARGNG